MHRRSEAGRLTREERFDIYKRIKGGETFETAALAVGCSTKSIQRLLKQTGGALPRMRQRAQLRLSVREREEISRGLVAGLSLRAIAQTIGRAPSTVSRDVSALGGRDAYRVWRAEERADVQAQRPKPRKLAVAGPLRDAVEAGLARSWSPQQIAARLTKDFPVHSTMRVSHETIYKSLFVQAGGALRKELTACLRTGRAQRRRGKRLHPAGQLKNMVMVTKRPPEAADRAVPAHWEGDLVIGRAGLSGVATLVERRSRYLMLLRLPHGRTAERVRDALTRCVRKLPAHLRRSLTWDQGKEMAEHARFTVDTKVDVFFCEPHSPWQRGTNENTNGLLRQYLPKGMDLKGVSARELETIAHELNNRPRKTLAWRTPAEVFNASVAMAV